MDPQAIIVPLLSLVHMLAAAWCAAVVAALALWVLAAWGALR